ncbi:MAG TPA: RNA-guided endonuclease TnpB family protein, partial [Gammaproteobacteria bacterium]|nr:RNA-guided endonuclease TnpB family protein [Gammaproteobacteria bacterium]
VTKNAPQMAIIQLGQAFKNFFKKKASYPRFKKKWVNDSFTITNDQFTVKDSRIRIPLLGWVRMHESLRFIGKIVSATISRVAKKWFVSISVEMLDENPRSANENQVAVGVDLGILSFATLSTGEIIEGPKPHKRLLSRIRRLSKSLSRKQKGSNNRHKAKQKLSTLHYRISNIRRDAQHKLTTRLVNDFDIMGIETLHVKNMMKNRKLSRSIADMGWFEFRRQLEYKAAAEGKAVIVADKWFASSKICSHCTHKRESLPLSVRTWICPDCATTHDRDINAAINLKNMAVSSTVSATLLKQSDAHACGAPANGIAA